nr:hypothetical protein [uncultured Draconibacterium sp.]
MAESNCAECTLRAKYDEKPKSFAGRFWRWHINWCPGWKGYMKSLDEEERVELKQQYHLNK